ncbi:MAG: homogentisate 1,2-dioxygenase [Legionellales bacterium RIFCSPHIGHO2_12_FULL_42_9]|nr:MAG: homogentisate 1,2-dioxygenase [Legionellales bacterium RIFCSPHIGHO2_12_FULL_42_9]
MYLAGFGNYHQTEATAGALPPDQNSPQQCPLGLYAEQLSGSAFTRSRHLNLRSWLYRIKPSVVQGDYQLYSKKPLLVLEERQAPNPYRWSAFTHPNKAIDFIDGLIPIAGNHLVSTFIYQCNQSMHDRFFSTSDGELLFVPYLGDVLMFTEFGNLSIVPGQIAVIPRGIKFRIELMSPIACGYLCENRVAPLTLPQLGPIGANGLANPRHFLYPKAAYEESHTQTTLICKYQGHLWTAKSDHSPLNVMAWHGNYAPYCYDLSLFNTISSVSFDHPDPSIFTVLTSESTTPGIANLDFVIFPSRWMVAEHTFRPPYFHRNVMSELMGLVKGEYDAKKEGFMPGGISIHNCMAGHGPDNDSYQQAINDPLKPVHYDNTLAFMFESCEPWNVTTTAFKSKNRQLDYSHCWQDLPAH